MSEPFVVSGGFAPDDEATRLTRLNQIMILGSLVAGIGLSALTSAGMGFPGRFVTLTTNVSRAAAVHSSASLTIDAYHFLAITVQPGTKQGSTRITTNR